MGHRLCDPSTRAEDRFSTRSPLGVQLQLRDRPRPVSCRQSANMPTNGSRKGPGIRVESNRLREIGDARLIRTLVAMSVASLVVCPPIVRGKL